MTTPIVSPQALSGVAPVRGTDVLSAPAGPALPLVPGERCEALVVGLGADRQVRLQIGGVTLTAQSQAPLALGETLTVRVEQLSPAVVLRIDGGATGIDPRLGDALRTFRARPDALLGILREALALLSPDAPSLPALPEKERQGLLRLLGRMILSPATVDRPLFLQEGLRALGLGFEAGLLRGLGGAPASGGGAPAEALKALLLKAVAGTADGEAEGGATAAGKGTVWGGFAEQALRVIESLQLVNILAQAQDGLFLFQIPCQCADGLRMQELFIEGEPGGEGEGAGRGRRLLLFLDLDALGSLAVEADWGAERFQGTIKGPDRAVLAYLRPLLPELETRLAALGCRAPRLQCLWQEDLHAWKRETLSRYRLYAQNSISVSA